jgi:RimJ/RimL family protein N-acetyltransferase
MKYFKKLVGEHVYISPMNIADAETYAKWLNNSSITQYLSIHNSLVTCEGEREYLEACGKQEFQMCIVKCENDELIGNIGLNGVDYKNGTAELGIFIGEENNLGKGYGTEAINLLTNYAFNELRLHTIYLIVYDINERAMKAYNKCGFVECGRRHEAVYRHGKYIDLVYMELINKNI